MVARGTEERRARLCGAALQCLRRRYGELDLALEDVADEVQTSPRHLQRVLREVGGTTFRDALLEVRMKRARELISRPRHPVPIYKVAPQVGYRKSSGLRQAFVRYWGCNPSEFQAPPPEALWFEADRRLKRG